MRNQRRARAPLFCRALPAILAGPLVLCCVFGEAPAAASDEPTSTTLIPEMRHLRNAEPREWNEFPRQAEARQLDVPFPASRNESEYCLRVRQQDVKQQWNVSLNGKPLGTLQRDENDMVVYFAVPESTLITGNNLLRIETRASDPDDIRVGQMVLDPRPRAEVLSAGQVELRVVDADSQLPLPARLTVLDQNGSLHSVGNESGGQLAVRPGIVYTGTGRATLALPGGRFTVFAGHGFEYGIDSVQVESVRGKSSAETLSIRREVPTPGWVSCDTHVHTVTYSGHGDATIEERMITLAAESIELPIATDHNVHTDYEPVAARLGLRRYFTPVIGNEVTTQLGHFNVFPLRSGAAPPDFRLKDWQSIFESIFGTPDVKIVVLNHARDIHGGFRPFGPAHHNAVTGQNLHGWKLRANAMELINSAAQQTDVMRLYHDWFGMLNRGFLLAPIGASDSHDVGRHFVGQARTYVRCRDDDPGGIDVAEAVDSIQRGRVMVSLGLLAEISIDEKYGPGDLAPADDDVTVSVRVLGPSWTEANQVTLFVNGQPWQQVDIEPSRGRKGGVKWSGEWRLPRPRHDVHLVALARGPGIRELYWPIAKPYQAVSADWQPFVIGSSGALWLDADGDGEPTPAYEYARQLLAENAGRLPQLLEQLGRFDEAVASQVAGLLQQRGEPLLADESQAQLRQAAPHVQRGFRSYLAAWTENQRAQLEQ